MATILIHPTFGHDAKAIQALAAQTGTTPVSSSSGRHLRLERAFPALRRRPHPSHFGGDAA